MVPLKSKITLIKIHTCLIMNIPDENEYFKETIDLNFDFAYGEEKFGYDAVEAYLGIRHKGIWGKALSFADRDSGESSPARIKLDETLFGGHSHYTSRAVYGLREAWIKFVLNPVFGQGWQLFTEFGTRLVPVPVGARYSPWQRIWL